MKNILTKIVSWFARRLGATVECLFLLVLGALAVAGSVALLSFVMAFLLAVVVFTAAGFSAYLAIMWIVGMIDYNSYKQAAFWKDSDDEDILGEENES